MTHVDMEHPRHPLARFADGAVGTGSGKPVPLIETAVAVRLRGGMAVVEIGRTFRNSETASIEATVTFPVPVHAVLFQLQAIVGGRTLVARAEARDKARTVYETAITSGQTAVLHEEVLKGIHVLTVGNIGPGQEIRVIGCFATLMTVTDTGTARLRIPTTVGAIYGVSPLPRSTDLRSGGPASTGRLTVEADGAGVEVNGSPIGPGPVPVALDLPIDIRTALRLPNRLEARAADGRRLTVTFDRAGGDPGPLDAAILIDRSGSMSGRAGAGGRTKHAAAVRALAEIGPGLGPSEVLDVFEFSDDCRYVGRLGKENVQRVVEGLDPPGGGTEIGAALESVIRASSAATVIVLTDGKSHALDVHALARAGRRLIAILVGDDSLEARIGELAALSGGDILVVPDDALQGALTAAVDLARSPVRPVPAIDGMPRDLAVLRGGLLVQARWDPAGDDAQPSPGLPPAALSAFAMSMALPAMTRDVAVQAAVAEGICSHLTSLVLVDEDGDRQSTLPRSRPVALPTPRFDTFACSPVQPSVSASAPVGRPRGLRPSAPAPSPTGPRSAQSRIASPALARLTAISIDWGSCADLLAAADLSGLPIRTTRALQLACLDLSIVEGARVLGVPVIRYLLIVLSLRDSDRDHHAARVLDQLLAGLDHGRVGLG